MTLTIKISAAVLFSLLFNLSAAAEFTVASKTTRTPLVELYTSEGCSSCPPADNFLSNLGKSLNDEFHAVALSFHVDYWNYLGWTDPYAQSKFTTRQREVATNNRQRSIYTPELVVDGREARGGGKKIVSAIMKANRQVAEARILLNLDAQDEAVVANISINNKSSARAVVYAAVFENDITREIRGGENRGRILQHDFVVRHWSAPLSVASGATQFNHLIKIPNNWNKNNLGIAVVVLDKDNGATVQSLQTSLAKLFKG